MKILIKILIIAVATFVGARLIPGVHLSEDIQTIFIVAVTLGLLNGILRPILKFLTIPITIVTLGLFLLVINAGMILLASNLVDGFTVDGFFPALLFSFVLSIISLIFKGFDKKKKNS